MTLIVADQLRGITRGITITDTNGATITPVTGDDKMRAIICRLSELAGTADTPTGFKFLVDSDAPSANGSSFTLGVSNTLRLDAQDLATIEPGVYTLLIDFFDLSDASEWKTVDRQVLVLGET